MAMPAWKGRERWTGGDATLDKVGAIDWKTKEFLVTNAEPLMQQLRAAAEEEAAWEETLIAVTEFLAFVLMALTQGPKWAHQYILYATDNLSVKDWLRTRRPKHRHGRVLGRILTRLEAKHKSATTSVYVRT